MNIIKISRKRDQHKKRVAAYCRVSTLLEEQEDSIETQSNYYQSYIASHDDWDFAGIYSDEKSGLDAEKRKGFQQMIKDALEGRVDYILVKNVPVSQGTSLTARSILTFYTATGLTSISRKRISTQPIRAVRCYCLSCRSLPRTRAKASLRMSSGQ